MSIYKEKFKKKIKIYFQMSSSKPHTAPIRTQIPPISQLKTMRRIPKVKRRSQCHGKGSSGLIATSTVKDAIIIPIRFCTNLPKPNISYQLSIRVVVEI